MTRPDIMVSGEKMLPLASLPTDQAMHFWMVDDAPSSWGHRNFILNCNIHNMGVGHSQGGPGGHYWTFDGAQ